MDWKLGWTLEARLRPLIDDLVENPDDAALLLDEVMAAIERELDLFPPKRGE